MSDESTIESDNGQTLGKRIRTKRKDLYLNQQQVADHVGVDRASVSNWERDENYPTRENLVLLAEILKTTPSFLSNGKDVFDIPPEKTSINFNDEFTIIPLYSAVLSGGPGSLMTSDEIKANFAFRTEFIRRKGNGKHLCLFAVKGSSMAPEIHDKDIVMVNRAENDPMQIADGKIYAFRDESVVKVKRLSRQGKKISVTSGPGSNPKEEGVIEDFTDFELFGPVVWVGHDMEGGD